MSKIKIPGYVGTIARVDLTSGQVSDEEVDPVTLRKYLGGSGLGIKYLYEEVPPDVEWFDPRNRLLIFSGPFEATPVAGSGTFSIVTKGPMTNMAGTSQANGFFGAFLRLSGFDGVILQGKAEEWSYLYIHDGLIEIRSAKYLQGKDTWQTEQALKQKLGSNTSIFCIGPGGENLVRFACIEGDRGHVVARNGVGAVMGSKRVKAIVVTRGKADILIDNPAALKKAAKGLIEHAMTKGLGGMMPAIVKWGSSAFYSVMEKTGQLPVRNYTTDIFPEHERFTGEYLRTHFMIQPHSCWACPIGHCHIMTVTEGLYTGFEGEEPEYEQIATFSSQVGQTDPGAVVMLSNLGDWLGIDVNETGWVLGWVMECYEKGILTRNQLDGLDMVWGNVEAIKALMYKIANREGIGDLLAEGVKRAAEKVGGEAPNLGVYTLKGNTPRTHDHRGRWSELVDTCFSNTSTLECTGKVPETWDLGLPPVKDKFDPEEVSRLHGQLNGRRLFEDSLVVCFYCASDFQLTVDCLNAITGWDFTIQEAMEMGRRAVNQLRLYNLRHGFTKEQDAPSARYGSAPVDGPNKGISILDHWDLIQRNYYKHMDWDPETGKPLPETLRRLGLGHLVPDLEKL